ncbi:caspase family protein [Neotabrizicola sp. VNH66]|uniref:caspase family protein n=1 Tax=Neotabrizicola sp. VNH66 TaxID=3400918 RepID=UPI003C116739
MRFWLRLLIALALLLPGMALARTCPPPDPDFTPVLEPSGRSGAPLALRWTDPWPKTEGCDDGRYLVLSLPERSRIAGPGAMLLGPGDLAPGGMTWRADGLRAFIPVDRARSSSGEITLLPYVTGDYAVDWALVHLAPGGEEDLLATGRLQSRILPGTPEVVVFDANATDAPQQRIRSNSGAFILEVREGHFIVRDTASGVPVYSGEGWFPAFSPGSRFVHAFRPESGGELSPWESGTLFSDLDVIDLKAGVPVLQLRAAGFASRGDFITGLLWSPGDSFLTLFFEANGSMSMKPMLTDGPLWGGHYSCGACSPWGEAVVLIDADSGAAWMGAGHADAGRSLYFPDEMVTEAPDRLPETGPDGGHPLLRDMLGPPRSSYLAGTRDETDLGALELVSHTVIAANDTIASDAGEAMTRAATALSGSDLGARGEGRMEDRLADLGLAARATLRLRSDVVPMEFLRLSDEESDALYQRDVVPPHWITPGGYYADSGGAALAAGLASPEEAARLTQLSAAAMENGYCTVSRAEDAIVTTWRSAAGVLSQLLQVHCRVGTGYEPEGFLYLLRLDDAQDRLVLVSEVLRYEDREEPEAAGVEVIDVLPWIDEDTEATEVLVPALPVDVAAQLPLRITRLGDDLIAIAGMNGRVLLLDAATGGVRQLFLGLPAPEQIARIALTETGGHLLQLQKDGQFHVYAAGTGDRLLSGIWLDDEVMVFDPAFRFDSTPEGAAYVSLRFPGEMSLYTLEQMGARLRTPGLVAEILQAGTAMATTALPDALPPRLSVTASDLVAGRLSLQAEADGGLSAVELYRDGVLVLRQPVQGTGAALTLDLPLLPETRWISARAVDRAGLTSALAVVPVSAGTGPPRGRLVALVVGIDDFSDPRLPDLGFAIADARAFADAVSRAAGRGRYADVTVEMISPKAPLAVALPQRIAAVSAGLGPEDTLMVYLATHGVTGPAGSALEGQLFLTDSQTRLDRLDRTALGMTQLAAALAAVPARVVVFVDACHAGLPDSATNDALQERLSGAESRIAVIAAAKGRQVSLEGVRLGGGAFTSAVVRALDRAETDLDGNGALELTELYAAVKRDVVLATAGRQTPWIARSGFVGEVPLF